MEMAIPILPRRGVAAGESGSCRGILSRSAKRAQHAISNARRPLSRSSRMKWERTLPHANGRIAPWRDCPPGGKRSRYAGCWGSPTNASASVKAERKDGPFQKMKRPAMAGLLGILSPDRDIPESRRRSRGESPEHPPHKPPPIPKLPSERHPLCPDPRVYSAERGTCPAILPTPSAIRLRPFEALSNLRHACTPPVEQKAALRSAIPVNHETGRIRREEARSGE